MLLWEEPVKLNVALPPSLPASKQRMVMVDGIQVPRLDQGPNDYFDFFPDSSRAFASV